MDIRKATANDINAIVEIHLDAFKTFFLTSLGSSFLKFYYTCFVKSIETVTLVAEENGKIYGFSASTKVCKGFNSRLIKNNLVSFGIVSLKMLFTTPTSLIRLVKNLTKKSEVVEDDENYAELYSIGVSNDAHIYSSAKIYYPHNLVMEVFSTIGPNVNIYNVDKIFIKDSSF